MSDLRDDSHLSSQFSVDPEGALRVDTLFVRESLIDAIIARAKEEGGFNEEYLKGAFLSFVTVPPRPIPEEVEKVFSRPQGKQWKVEIKVMMGHWILAQFLKKHSHVEVTHSEGRLIAKCMNCWKSVSLPTNRVPKAPSYYRINLEDCDGIQ